MQTLKKISIMPRCETHKKGKYKTYGRIRWGSPPVWNDGCVYISQSRKIPFICLSLYVTLYIRFITIFHYDLPFSSDTRALSAERAIVTKNSP